MTKQVDTVKYAIYDIIREVNPSENEPFYEWVEFEIINYTKNRTHKFWAFLDELAPRNFSDGHRCFPLCNCNQCNELRNEESNLFQQFKNTYNFDWPEFNIAKLITPRGIKFTPESQVSNKRPKTFDREYRMNKQEIIYVIKAINEIILRHRTKVGSFPYIALPVSEKLDSLYKKAVNNKLGVDLHYSVSRVTIKQDGQECGAAYVIC